MNRQMVLVACISWTLVIGCGPSNGSKSNPSVRMQNRKLPSKYASCRTFGPPTLDLERSQVQGCLSGWRAPHWLLQRKLRRSRLSITKSGWGGKTELEGEPFA